jgi:hypothetical protein
MALSNAEKQARWRERHLKHENGTKLRAQFVLMRTPLGSSSAWPSTENARLRPSSGNGRRTPRGGSLNGSRPVRRSAITTDNDAASSMTAVTSSNYNNKVHP